MSDKKPSLAVQEYELLKKVFRDQTELLRQIRTLLLGFEIGDDYKKQIAGTFSDPLVFKAFRKKIFVDYEIDTPEAPLEAISDIWSNSTTIVSGAFPERIKQETSMRQRTLEMLRQGVGLLLDPNGLKVNTIYNPVVANDPLGIELMARNYYVGSIQQGIANMSIMIQSEQLTLEQAKKKAKKDSAE